MNNTPEQSHQGDHPYAKSLPNNKKAHRLANTRNAYTQWRYITSISKTLYLRNHIPLSGTTIKHARCNCICMQVKKRPGCTVCASFIKWGLNEFISLNSFMIIGNLMQKLYDAYVFLRRNTVTLQCHSRTRQYTWKCFLSSSLLQKSACRMY